MTGALTSGSCIPRRLRMTIKMMTPTTILL